MTRREHPIAFATSASFLIEAIKASFEKGRTIPDVPMIEIPPTIPNFGLNVRAANSFPPGTEIVTTTSFILPDQAVFFQYCCQFFGNQAAGSGVDGWSAYFEAETGKRYRTDPFTAAKQDNGDGGLSCLQLDTGDDGTAVCHVRIRRRSPL